MLHLVAVTDLIVDHLTESREADAEAARFRHRAAPKAAPARHGLLGAFARAMFGARA